MRRAGTICLYSVSFLGDVLQNREYSMNDNEKKEKKIMMTLFQIFQCFLIPVGIFSVFASVYWLTSGKENMKKNKIMKQIHREVLNGNKVAIAIKIDAYSWMTSAENEDLIMAALDGNEGAIKALRINVDRPNRNY